MWEKDITKFMYRLSDSTSTVQRPVRQPIKRVEPTEEAKLAGQAALARLEAKQNASKYNRTYAAIKAQVQRELEQERKAQQIEQPVDKKTSQKSEESVRNESSLAVADVYFRCPYLSDEILPKEEWKMKIRSFLYEQLKGEEAGLTACLVIQNCNPRRDKIESCVETLSKYLENIINNLEIEKYRRIRMQNKIFEERVRPIDGAMDFLHAAGFRETKLLYNDVEEDFLLWSPENCDIENLTILLEALKSAETIPLELDRNLQVLMPVQASRKHELPSTFFSITPQELKREQQLRTETFEKSQMLMTKAMREREEKQRRRIYRYSLLRIKFPDNIILQGTFFVHEKFQNVFDFISECLENNELPFCLKMIGKTFDQTCFDKTLLELELCPSVTLMFIPLNNAQLNDSIGYVKEELLSLVQS
ncbi:GDI interacting protein 3 isoform X2 [Augochlora pura]